MLANLTCRTGISTTIKQIAIHPKRTSFRHVSIRAMSGESLSKATPEEKWKELLTAEEFYVLRQKGTEPAGTGEYDKFYEEGVYKCRGCGNPVFTSDSKFSSGCGWPAFDAEIPGAVERHTDTAYGMVRTEITCGNCGGHLGHVFQGEQFTATNERHCVNSLSVKFEPKK